MSYSVWVELEVQEGKLELFMQAIAENQIATLEEPGCSYFDVIQLSDMRFGFYEIYRDEAAFKEEHRTYPHYLKWREAVTETVVAGSQIITTGTIVIPSK